MLLNNYLAEKKIFNSRITITSLIMVLCTSILLINIYYLQVTQHKKYLTASHDNRIMIQPITPSRGIIYDRNHIALTATKPRYSLQLVKERVVDLKLVTQDIQARIKLTAPEISWIKTLISQKKRPFEPFLLKQLTPQETAILAGDLHNMPGFSIVATPIRHYPYAAITSHALGYVGLMSKTDVFNLKEPSNYRGSKYIGKTGIEKRYERLLHGEIGKEQVEINARGRILSRLQHTAPLAGANITLHLDIKLQTRAHQLLAGKKGAVVAINPATGGILAMVSQPSFNPNLFIANLDNQQLNKLMHNVDHPLFNRSIKGQYPPASTIKPFMSIAGLASKIITPKYKIRDPGWYRLANEKRVYHDWKEKGHGIVNLQQAIYMSCDTYFYNLAYKLGIDNISPYLSAFGFGKKSSLDITDEASGILPSKKWKFQNKYTAWLNGDSLNTAIGQGYFLATPLQLATAVTIIANKGLFINPRMLHKINDTPYSWKQDHKPIIKQFNDWQFITTSMKKVMHHYKGTGYATGRYAKYKIAGKTGTAQVFSFKQTAGKRLNKKDEVADKLQDHSLFIGFAPADNPQIALAVLIENGGNGSSAATPMAKKLFDHYLKNNTKHLVQKIKVSQ